MLMDAVSRGQPVDIIAKQFEHRSLTAIDCRIKDLRVYGQARFAIRRGIWQKEELVLLKEMFNDKITYKDMALKLGRSYLSVKHRVRLLRQESIRPRAETS